MYFISEEHEIHDKKDRFVCSIIFIVKNKSKDEFDSTEFNEKVGFTVSFLVNNFLLSLFHNCQEGNKIGEMIKSLNDKDIEFCENFSKKEASKPSSYYSVISLDRLNEEITIKH